jgi:hypothetical protein
VHTIGRDGVADVKSIAWKDTVGLFLCLLAVHFCWKFIAHTGDSAIHMFGVSALAAIFFYIYKRKDWFD